MPQGSVKIAENQVLPVTITVFKSSSGKLSKRYDLASDGSIVKNPAANMVSGTAQRVSMDFTLFGKALMAADAKTAFGYGLPDAEYGETVRITIDGKENPAKGILARTQRHFHYRAEPGVLMVDHDPQPRGRTVKPDELICAISNFFPEFRNAGHCIRGSISAGVHRIGEEPKAGGSFHLYNPVPDQSDIPRFGEVLFKRLWLAGYGFIAISAAGTFLVRSIIDSAVFRGERLDFVGAPIVGDGLAWTPPEPVYRPGGYLDTRLLPNLTEGEEHRVKELIAAAKSEAEPERARIRAAWLERQVQRMVERGTPEPRAREAVANIAKDGARFDLCGDFVLDFSDGESVSVDDILRNPSKYDGRALADPFEGTGYGRTTAKLFANQGGAPCINSHAHGGIKYFLHMSQKQMETGKRTQDRPEQDRPTQSQILVEMGAAYDLWHTPENRAYVTLSVNGHHEHWPVRSKTLKQYLARKFFEEYGKPPGTQALAEALTVLEAMANFQGEEHEDFVRVAGRAGRVYLDLCDTHWQVIEISTTGWRVLSSEESPVKFRRTKGMLPLPIPLHGGSVNDLRPFINAPTEDIWRVCVGWLVQALRPKGPFIVLQMEGEQGSGKTSGARYLRSVIDPSTAPVRTIPRDERDLMIAANNARAIVFDNLSGTPLWLSDSLCRLSTGGGFSTRELFSNDDEVIFEAMRPIILTGIDQVSDRHDLIDRSIILNLPPLTGRRIPEEELRTRFEKAHPYILGAICDAVSAALKNLPNTTLADLPRMADAALWVTAAESALPWEKGGFIEAYTRNRKEAVEISLESDVVCCAVREFMSSRNEWEGRSSNLLDALCDCVSEKVQKQKSWPKRPNSLSNRLRRGATFLRAVGIEVDFFREPGSGERRIRVFRMGREKIVTCVTTVTDDQQDRINTRVCAVTIGCDDPTSRIQDRHKTSSYTKPALNKGLQGACGDHDDRDDLFHLLSKPDTVTENEEVF